MKSSNDKSPQYSGCRPSLYNATFCLNFYFISKVFSFYVLETQHVTSLKSDCVVYIKQLRFSSPLIHPIITCFFAFLLSKSVDLSMFNKEISHFFILKTYNHSQSSFTCVHKGWDFVKKKEKKRKKC